MHFLADTTATRIEPGNATEDGARCRTTRKIYAPHLWPCCALFHRGKIPAAMRRLMARRPTTSGCSERFGPIPSVLAGAVLVGVPGAVIATGVVAARHLKSGSGESEAEKDPPAKA
jgi:hypothetical protein